MTPPTCSRCPLWIPKASRDSGIELCDRCESQAWMEWNDLSQAPDPLFLQPPLVSFRLIGWWLKKGVA